ncbi:uncharacterized protein DUF916 [Motilibacter rhizosphaerae]|uniref:Uncharacterized protein DUF916 n=1 Tax=Motilibacter rhizosphaerae TaxID=598652 RepID=A0A4Q7NVI3_9ACTN|nr:Ig-like domain repeat protein [Motilibacter rhizosphaerae]RZS91197.1 uncharacterized protein DUF916 [Motilibacter rhizosphaerae]
MIALRVPPPARRHPRRRAAVLAATAAAAAGIAFPPAVALAAPRPAGASSTAPVPAGTKVTFGVQPASGGKADPRTGFSYTATPGATAKDEAAIINLSVVPIVVAVYPTDAETTTDGSFALLPAASRPKDVGSWVSLGGAREVTVPARSSVIVPVTLKVPADATPGDHTGAVIASLATYARNKNGDRIRLDQRVGARLTVRVTGPLRPSLSITGLRARYHASWNPLAGRADVSYTVTNTGNVRLSAKQIVRITGWLGGTAVSGASLHPVPELLPKGSLTVHTTVTHVRAALRMTALVRLDPTKRAGDIDPTLRPVEARVQFWALPWLVLGLLLLAVLGGGWAWRRRRRPPAAPTPAPSLPSEDQEPVMSSSSAAVPVERSASVRRAPGWGLARLVVAVATLLGGTAGAALPALAATAPARTAGVTPATGKDTTIPTFRTSAPCPAGSATFYALVLGPGFPKDGEPIRTVNDLGISLTKPFSFKASLSFYDVAAMYGGGHRMKGTYTLRVVCQGEFTETMRTFDAKVVFDAHQHYHVVRPAVRRTSSGPAGAPAAAPGAGDVTRTSGGTAITVTTLTSAMPKKLGSAGPFTFTAHVRDLTGGHPAGFVTFFDGNRMLGRGALGADGTAVMSVGTLGVGEHVISATFTPSGSKEQMSVSAQTSWTVLSPSVRSLPQQRVSAAAQRKGDHQRLTAALVAGVVVALLVGLGGPLLALSRRLAGRRPRPSV